jgi:hypothetical protein
MTMSAIVELILSIIDLVRAELKLAKLSFVQFVSGVILVFAAALMFVGAMGFFLAAIYLLLLQVVVDKPLAMLLTGVLLLLLSLIVAWLGSRKMKR